MLTALVAWMNGLPPEAMLVIEMAVCFTLIPVMLRLFGPAGMFVYIAIGIVGANIQVLKAVKFSIFSDPTALGTVLFASSYLCTDVLTEYYGRAMARRGILLGFAAMLLMTVMMMLAMGYRPMTPAEAGDAMAWALPNHDHIVALFLPAPTLLAASMTSYLISQFNDVMVFQKIRRITGVRHMWLRAAGSTAISALVDNTIFNTLAWVVFPWIIGETPLSIGALIFTYIIGTYWIRLAMALIEAPYIYVAGWFLPAEDRQRYRAETQGGSGHLVSFTV
ncbi:MAG TPA: queuosine precursor transporter [Dongiaceae bacterium]|nr:queuosine precursor transporter [Dongiaceae bacterium]